MKHKIKTITLISLPLLLLGLFFSLTNPHNLSAPVFLVPILLLLVSFYLLAWFIIKKASFPARKSVTRNTLALIIAVVFTSMVVLQSIDQLTAWDFVLFLLLAVMFVGYIRKISSSL